MPSSKSSQDMGSHDITEPGRDWCLLNTTDTMSRLAAQCYPRAGLDETQRACPNRIMFFFPVCIGGTLNMSPGMTQIAVPIY